MIRTEIISNKKIYIFEEHNYAILPWNEMTESTKIKPYLLTLDYHTDTHDAFLNYIYFNHNSNLQKNHLKSLELCNKMKEDFYTYVKLLKNDEHIDAAIKAGIISHCYVIQNSNSMSTISIEENNYIKLDHFTKLDMSYPQPPYSYIIPKNKIFITPSPYCDSTCVKKTHDEECDKKNADKAIESYNLSRCFSYINQMSITSGIGCLKNTPFILDIDLDYFNTEKSIHPDDISFFYNLIRNSIGITIAKESVCVNMLKKEGENINSDLLLESLLEHIRIALSI